MSLYDIFSKISKLISPDYRFVHQWQTTRYEFKTVEVGAGFSIRTSSDISLSVRKPAAVLTRNPIVRAGDSYANAYRVGPNLRSA